MKSMSKLERLQDFFKRYDCDLILNKNRCAELQIFLENDDEEDFPVEYDGTVEDLIHELVLSLEAFDSNESAYSSIVCSVNPTIAEMRYICDNALDTEYFCKTLANDLERKFSEQA